MDSFPTIPLRIFATQIFVGVPLQFIVPAGCYVTAGGFALIGSLDFDLPPNQFILTWADVPIFSTLIEGTAVTNFFTLFPPFIAHDGELIQVELDGDSASTVFFTMSGTIGAKMGPIS